MNTLEAVRLLAQGPVRVKDHPGSRRTLYRLVERGAADAPFPGVLILRTSVDPLAHRLAALCLWDADAVVLGAAAARLTYWDGVPVPTITAYSARRFAGTPGFRLVHGRLDPWLIGERMGIRFSRVPLTALDLAEATQGGSIDQALRSRATTLPQLRQVLAATPHRPGNAARRRWLVDSRAEPWSAAERLAHRLLHEAGISGWSANHPVQVGPRRDRRRYYLDIAFPRARVAIEIDGRFHETDGTVFEADRRRQNELIDQGWLVLRFTWTMLTDDPAGFVKAVANLVERRTMLARSDHHSRMEAS